MDYLGTFVSKCVKAQFFSKANATAMWGMRDKELRAFDGDLDYWKTFVRMGFISQDEADRTRENPTELPKGKAPLIASYVAARRVFPNAIMRTDFYDNFYAAMHEVDYPNKGSNPTIKDFFNKEEYAPLREAIAEVYVREAIENARAFVCSKRRRLRAELKKLLLVYMCYELTKEPDYDEASDTHFYSGYALRERLEKAGFDFGADTLSDADRERLSQVADSYLDILEAAHITGEADKRIKDYVESDDNATYWYRDEMEEVVLNFINVFWGLRMVFASAINNYIATRDDISEPDFVKIICSLDFVDRDAVEAIRGTKYEDYLEALPTADQLREALPANVFDIYQSAIAEAEQEQEPTK